MTTKKCFKCLCEKPLNAFYKHAEMADKHLNKCKECTKKDVLEHRQDDLPDGLLGRIDAVLDAV